MGGIYKDRKAVVVSWETGYYEGPVRLVTSNEEGNSGTNLDSNAGYAALTYPPDWKGETHVVVYDNESNVLDEFDIKV